MCTHVHSAATTPVWSTEVATADATGEDGAVDLALDTLTADGTTVVVVGGELDAVTAPQLRAYLGPLVKRTAARVVLDLSDVTFLDSTGLGALIEARSTVAADGGAFALVVTASRVAKVLTITGLDEALSMRDTREAALAAVR